MVERSHSILVEVSTLDGAAGDGGHYFLFDIEITPPTLLARYVPVLNLCNMPEVGTLYLDFEPTSLRESSQRGVEYAPREALQI
ncbi:hypothetical protein BDV98DRAFT_568435 [Pterulicium gracile]|uniref:Uncharacterized protein n=1 Tax=Pterulicium gracile TaxID=1884261 RepID=A0A5C3QG74_9AGAR|nr:hypothetical protein BDV98DRAFT_568435 [Pterula gracilis]